MADNSPVLQQLPAPIGASPQPSASALYENNEYLQKQRELVERAAAEMQAERDAMNARRDEENRLASEREATRLREYQEKQALDLRHTILFEPFRQYVRRTFNREPGPAKNVLVVAGGVVGGVTLARWVTKPDDPAWQRLFAFVVGSAAAGFVANELYKVVVNAAVFAIPEQLPLEVEYDLVEKFRSRGAKDIPAQIHACRFEWAAMARAENEARPANPLLTSAGAIAAGVINSKLPR